MNIISIDRTIGYIGQRFCIAKEMLSLIIFTAGPCPPTSTLYAIELVFVRGYKRATGAPLKVHRQYVEPVVELKKLALPTPRCQSTDAVARMRSWLLGLSYYGLEI